MRRSRPLFTMSVATARARIASVFIAPLSTLATPSV
jgi:hypothetical protein